MKTFKVTRIPREAGKWTETLRWLKKMWEKGNTTAMYTGPAKFMPCRIRAAIFTCSGPFLSSTFYKVDEMIERDVGKEIVHGYTTVESE